MTVKQFKCGRAVTLVEVMVAMAVLAIASLGAVSYQYHAARQTQVASAQIVATRTAQLLLEDCKGTGGSIDYYPTGLRPGFSSTQPTPDYSQTVNVAIETLPQNIQPG